MISTPLPESFFGDLPMKARGSRPKSRRRRRRPARRTAVAVWAGAGGAIAVVVSFLVAKTNLLEDLLPVEVAIPNQVRTPRPPEPAQVEATHQPPATPLPPTPPPPHRPPAPDFDAVASSQAEKIRLCLEHLGIGSGTFRVRTLVSELGAATCLGVDDLERGGPADERVLRCVRSAVRTSRFPKGPGRVFEATVPAGPGR